MDYTPLMTKCELFVIEIDGNPSRFYRKQGTAKGVIKGWSKYKDVTNCRIVRYVPEDAVQR